MSTATVSESLPRDARALSRVTSTLRGGARRVAWLYLALLLVVTVLGKLIAPYGVNAIAVSNSFAGPSSSHLLGTDHLGRDILSRLLLGAQSAIGGVLLAIGIAAVVGVTVGLISGFSTRIVDEVLMRVVDALLAFPAMVMAVGVIGVLGPGLVDAMIAIGIIFVPLVARLTRGEVLSVRNADYVRYARAYGMSRPSIMLRHVLPNVAQPIIVQLTILSGIALIAEAGLSFLGLGAQPPSANWGAMLGDAFQYVQQQPTQMLAPGLAIVLTVVAFNALGDDLRDRFSVSRDS